MQKKPYIFTCAGICWGVGAAFGLLVAFLFDLGFILGLICALLLGFAAGWFLHWAFCQGAKPAVEAQPVPDVAAAPVVPRADPVVVDAPEMAIAADGKPEMLTGPRGGNADNLKLIKGVGPKLEAVLNGLGVYHFDQIAGWRAAEVVWVDDNLEGFKGRVSRDSWVAQARILASGEGTKFSRRAAKGEAQ